MPARIHVDDLRFLGDQFKEARKRLGLRRVELVREAGYQNTNKGCRRILHIERGEPPLADERVLERFAHVLDLDLDQLFEETHEREQKRREEQRERQKMWVGTLLKGAREQKGWSVEEVIEKAELSPADKYETRLERLESGEYRFPMMDELEALSETLDIAGLKAFAAYKKECEYYDRIGKKPSIVARLMPAFYNKVRYPEHFDTDRILRFAEEFSAKHGFKVCVTLPEGHSVYIEPDGHRFESRRSPTMSIR
jgi:transcriptional regulator with XRE-family HTH domain